MDDTTSARWITASLARPWNDATPEDDSSERTEPMSRTNETAWWSVVRGTSPYARAVEPEPAGVTIPAEVLTWAEGHGLSLDDPDTYILVATDDEAGEVGGEIASMKGEVPASDAAAIRAALAARDAERNEETAR